MRIAIVGAGYVGVTNGICLAELGHDIVCVDIDKEKIKKLKKGKLHIYEEGLEELLLKNLKSKSILFTEDLESSVKKSDIIIISVGTPFNKKRNNIDISYIEDISKKIAPFIKKYKVIAIKSTVPIGCCDGIDRLIRKENKKAKFDVVSLPEFLREGCSKSDFFNPDRIIIGTESKKADKILRKMYSFFKNKTNILTVSRLSSESIKYSSNAFLAIKLQYINEIANLCKKTGANIKEVSKGIGLDSRIGDNFLNPGPGYGGSCFPKDTVALSYIAKENNVDLSLVNSTIKGNNSRMEDMVRLINDNVDLKNEKIAVLGLSFKANTDDCRESPAISIVSKLVKLGANISVYDPEAINNAKKIMKDSVIYFNDIYKSVENVDALIILTEWDEFKNINLNKLSKLLRQKKIIDLRNVLSKDKVLKKGFEYIGI